MPFNHWKFSLCLLGLLLTACGSKTWEKLDRTTPLGTDGKPASYMSRFLGNSYNGPPRTEEIWRDSTGRQIEPETVVRSVEQYFREAGLTETFRKSGSWIGDQNQLVPEYRICIIAIEPTVVIMIPHNFGELDGRAIVGIRGDLDEWGDSEFTPLLLDGVFTGTDFPYEEGVKWFSPNSNAQPEVLESKQKQIFQIKMENVTIELQVDDGRIYATREK